MNIKSVLPICLFSLLLISFSATAQVERESEIRRLEDIEREAVLKRDSTVLFDKLWSAKMVINSPANVVNTVEGTKAMLRKGGLQYASFERTIEKISFYDDVAIVMGGEVIKPQGAQPNAGKTVSRRFTNIWKFADGNWSIIARHVTIINIE